MEFYQFLGITVEKEKKEDYGMDLVCGETEKMIFEGRKTSHHRDENTAHGPENLGIIIEMQGAKRVVLTYGLN